MVFLILTIHDDGITLMRSITRNCRVSYARIARETGQNYVTVKMKIERAISKGLLDIKPLVSAKLFGRVGAILRLKTRNPSRIIEFLSKCNRILGVMVNGEEIIAMAVGKDKVEIIAIINRLSLIGDGLLEYSIEYGELPSILLIPVKNCNICESECFNYILRGRSCLPSLNSKNNNSYRVK